MDRKLIKRDDPDRKWYQIPGLSDKGNHKLYGAAIFFLTWLPLSLWWAILTTLTAGVVWEYVGYLKGKKFDWEDIEATILGGVYAGAAIAGIIKLINFVKCYLIFNS